ncbi:hypothetical protein [Evansella cellulosilytica]|uniref:Uncharacterized protein n=1 Tax=Evansella cellulosilytica (strain ATCC 21833 / DSM 2522 / FERM P-1141 / JCM 9156 / N-4) TaxID=649639 RepID=E6TYF0_EVAC2|nr:hypothetical protein [Evansella cellulosilytica]ADU28888.1 hypothetical protein Bcell_0606 [Evansella cellulosilytica DSM 2522]
MDKKQIFSFAVMVMLVVAVSFFFRDTNRVEENEETEVEFNETDSVWSERGYVVETRIDNVEYMFTESTDLEKEEIVYNTEKVLQELQENFGINKDNIHVKLLYQTSENEATVDNSSNRVIIMQDEDASIGAVVSRFSDQKLPAWLSTGLELYWTSNENEYMDISEVNEWVIRAHELDGRDYGDAWFVPGFIDAEYTEAAHDIAHLFVKYLDEEGYLHDVVSFFVHGHGSNETLKQHWRSFTGITDAQLDVSYKYVYNYQHFLFELTRGKVNASFRGDNWEEETIIDHLTYMNETIEYVEDWFNYELEEELVVHMYREHASQYDHIPTTSQIITVYNVHDESSLWLVSYHVANIIKERSGLTSDFYPFTEGVVEAIHDEVISDLQFEGDNRVTHSMEEVYHNQDNETNRKILENYHVINGEPFEPGEGVDYRSFMFANSFLAFEYDDRFSSHQYSPDMDNYIEDLDGYIKSSSFILYLIEQQGKDDFLKVFESIEAFEEIYGATLEEMVAEWKTFIQVE